MRHRLYAHLIWTTRARAPILDAGLARFLDRFFRAVAGEERALLLEIGMVRTHVHLLLRLHPTTCIPRLVQRLKGASAVVANREHHTTTDAVLRWSKGYTVVSVGPAALEVARRYVRDQPRHHPELIILGWPGGTSLGASLEEEWLAADRIGLRAGVAAGEIHRRRRG